MPYSITREEAALDLQALRSILAKTDKDKVNYPAWYRLAELADSIEEQVKPAIEEPTEFGSIIRAWHPDDPKGVTADLWQRSPRNGKHTGKTGSATSRSGPN